MHLGGLCSQAIDLLSDLINTESTNIDAQLAEILVAIFFLLTRLIFM